MSQGAAVVVSKGSPFIITERPVPAPADDQILVRLTATGVHHIHPKQRDCGFFLPFKSTFPVILGCEGTGSVARLGKDVTKFSIGDRVIFQGLNGVDDEATFQEYALVSGHLAAKAPSFFSDVQSATLPMAAATAFVGLFDKSGAGIKPPFDGPTVDPSNGETPSIFIIGGSGSIGQAAIQFARITGFKRIVTTAKEEYTSYLEGLGATNVLDRFTTKDGAQVMKIAPDIRIVFDTISDGDTLDLALSVLSKKGGTVVRTLPYDGITPIPKNVDLKFVLGELHWNQSHLGPPFWQMMEIWMQEGDLKPNKTEVYDGLESINEAVERVREGVSGKKVVVKIA